MTREEILNMPAGEAIDALVAKVIGVDEYSHDFSDPNQCNKCNRERDQHSGRVYPDGKMTCDYPDSYSTEIEAAWQAVEEIGENETTLARRGNYWFCDFGDHEKFEYSQADTAPLAICRAALLAVMEL